MVEKKEREGLAGKKRKLQPFNEPNVYANTDRQRFVCTVEGCRRDHSRKDNLKQHVKQCHHG